MRSLLPLKNTNSSPRPRNGGEGSGSRGRWHPCHKKEIKESGKEKMPTNPQRFIRENPCSSVAKKHSTVLIRGSAKPASRELHPSPPAPLPFQGRGVLCALYCSQKTQIPPLAPNGGEGSGVRGPIPLETRPPPAPHIQTRLPHGSCPASVVSVASVVKKHP